MDRKRANTAPLLLDNRSVHGASQNDPFYTQFPSMEPKICKLLPDLPFSMSPEYKFTTSFKEELLDMWPDIPSLGSGSQPQVQNIRSGAEFVNNEQEPRNETTEAPSDYSASTSKTRRRTNFSDYNGSDDVPVVVLADSPNSQTSYSSEEDSDLVIYEGTTRREPRMDGSVVCLDNDDQETEDFPLDNDQSEIRSTTRLQDTTNPEPPTNVADLSTPSQITGNDDNVFSDFTGSRRAPSKPSESCFEQVPLKLEMKIESESEIIENLKAELNVHKQNYEWQEAKVRYLEIKLQERNDFEYKLEAVNQLNDMLEKKLSDLEKSASNLPIFEKELKRLREKTKLLEEDKRCKEELGQTISNLIDDKTNLKTENESLTSIAGMLEKENSTLKQKCETLKRVAESATICTGDNLLIAENCCIRSKELRDRMTESMENEFKCSICEEIFIEATVTNCNHVFCAHCLSEWMKKKKDCPYCRKHVTQQCRAPVIDEFVLTVCKLLSEKMHSDRLQVVQERKILSSKKVPLQTASRRTGSGAVRVVPIASLRNMSSSSRPMSYTPSYMRSGLSGSSSSGMNYYPPLVADETPMNNFEFYFNSLFTNGSSSTATATATATATSSMSSTSSASHSLAPVQSLPLDARIARPMSSSAQSTATAASSSMHVSSTSSISSKPVTATVILPMPAPVAPTTMPSAAKIASSAAAASSSTSINPTPPSYSYWRGSTGGNEDVPRFLPSSSLYNPSRPTVAAVNPFSTADETSTSQRTLTTSLSASHRSPLSNLRMH